MTISREILLFFQPAQARRTNQGWRITASAGKLASRLNLN
jgi:hypothetical protein